MKKILQKKTYQENYSRQRNSFSAKAFALTFQMRRPFVRSFPHVKSVLYINRNNEDYNFPEVYHKLIFDLRNPLKEVSIDRRYDEDYFGRTVDYLAQFPQLTTVDIRYSGEICSINDCLELIEKCPQLTSLTCLLTSDDEDDIQPSAMAIERLSKFKSLTVHQGTHMCFPALISFIKQYLTNLKKLTIFCTYSMSILRSIFEDLITLAWSIPEYDICIRRLDQYPMEKYLPEAMQNMYYQTPIDTKNVKPILEFELERDDGKASSEDFPYLINVSSMKSGNCLTRNVELSYAFRGGSYT